MNLAHRWFCRSRIWKGAVETHIAPWVLDGVDLGANVLEVGPGPGVTTDILRTRVARLTCVEIERGFADALARRLEGSNVRVLCEDATAMSLADAAFDGGPSEKRKVHGRPRRRQPLRVPVLRPTTMNAPAAGGVQAHRAATVSRTTWGRRPRRARSS
jgi:hypothetical protein